MVCGTGAHVVPVPPASAAAAATAFPAHATAPPSSQPAGQVVPGNFYPPITTPFASVACPTVIPVGSDGDCDLPDPAIGPDGQRAECDCESVRRGHGVCDGTIGGEVGDILEEKLEASLPDSNDEEFSCNSRYAVRVLAYVFDTAGSSWHVLCISQNDHKRFETYKACAIRLKFDSREPLPLCVVATIRAIFPEVSGIYVGFKAS
jgi:hypothetical protein